MTGPPRTIGAAKTPKTRLGLVSIVVDDYDPAIAFFVNVLGFEMVEDRPDVGSDGKAKRWVVVVPPGAETGVLLARASDEKQRNAIGNQTGGRVGFFLYVENFDECYRRMSDAGVRFLEEPRLADYGRVVVFLDIAGNKWDLIEPVREEGTVPFR